MVHFRRILCMILIFFVLNITIQAENSVKNPLEWIDELETVVTGEISEGSLFERLGKLEEMMTGRTREGSLVERLTRLENLLYVNQPYDVSLLFKIQALEWILYKKGFSGSLEARLEKIEKALFDTNYSGPVTKRLERLIIQVFPDGTIKGKWITIPEGLLIKVQMINELSSSQNKPGTRFQFEITDTVLENDYVLFPVGSTGNGLLKQVSKPSNLGRDARLMLDFAEVKALDGTPVKMYYGTKALEMDRSRQLAVGASAAGMLAFGPGGILLGLVVKGKEKMIPGGTEFYLQVKEPVRVYTIEK